MLEYILYAAIILLSLIGLVEIIRTAALFLLSEKHPPEQLLLVLLSGDNAETALRSALERVRMMGIRGCRRIIAVDMGMSSDSMEICRRLCNEYGCIILCTPDTLAELTCSLSPGGGKPEDFSR